MVGVEVDVGEELQQHPLGRLHHPVGDGGGDPAGPGHPAHPPHLALVGQLGGAEALADGAAEKDLPAAEGGGAAPDNLQLEAIVDKKVPGCGKN